MDNLKNELLSKLVGLIPDDSLRLVSTTFDSIAGKYDIVKKTTDLVIYNKQMPEEVSFYLADMKVRNLSDGTINNSKLTLKLFFEACAYKLPRDISTNEIRGYLYCYKQNRNVSDRYMDKVRQILNGFFVWCVENDYLVKNPMAQIKKQKFEIKPRVALTPMELEQVRNILTKPRDKAMLEFMYSTGCRVSEMCNLKLKDVNLDTGMVTLFGKGRKYRTDIMSDKCRLLLKEYLTNRKGNSEYLFSIEYAPYTDAINRNSVEKIVKNWGFLAGIDKPLTPHILRHTFATHCLARNVPVTSIQKALGHSNVATTMIYAETNEADVFSQIGKAIQ